MKREEAESLLGLEGPYDATILRDRWRLAARTHHPDRGGSNDLMAKVNEAYALLVRTEHHSLSITTSATRRDPVVRSVDRPAFVIDALPAVAYEALLVAARVLGEVLDDDPPYVLEAIVQHEDTTSWCRLELVPDAGATTVSITSDGRIPADDLCGLWVATVNELGLDQ